MAAFMLSGVLTLAIASPAGAFVWWTNWGDQAIGRANLDGSSATRAFIAVPQLSGVAVDNSHVYWNGVGSRGYTVGRAGLDGSGIQSPFIDNFSDRGVAVDGQFVYWAAGASIGRARLDGSQVQPQFITGINFVCGVAVDGAHIYWGDPDAGRVGRANLDGTGINLSFIEAAAPCGIAVNATHIFWGNYQGTSIARANLDGSAANQNFITGASNPCGVAVNGTHIYWSNERVSVGRANLDGSAVNQNFIAPMAGCGVALDALTTANVTVTPSAPQIVFGQDITFDAAVTGEGAVPTGSMQFFVNDAPDGAPAPLDATGHASYSPTFPLGVGDKVSAAYSGDAAYGAVRVPDASPIVQPAPTSTQLTVEPSTVVTGGQLAVIATVINTMTGITPFGSVQFVIDGELFGEPFELDENGQIAFGLIAAVPPADYLVTAHYVDDIPPFPYFLPSAGSQVVRVTAAPEAAPRTPTTSAGGSAPAPAQPAPTVVRKRDLTAIGAALIKGLKARGFAALTGPLSYTAPGPGTLTQSVFAQGARSNPSAARAKETLIATGRRMFSAAGTGTLRPRLSAVGRRMTKRAKRLKLRIVTRFAPTTGSAVSSSQRATVKRRGRRAKAAVSASGWTLITQP